MNVREIVENFLKANGYDGLYWEDECGCELEDLSPCCAGMENCEPGYKTPDPSGDSDWLIGPTKPEDINDESEDTRI